MAMANAPLRAVTAAAMLIGTLWLPAAWAQPAPAAGPRWVDSLNVGMSEALQARKLLLVYFRSNSVGACATMEQNAFANATVLREAEKLVMVRQDVEQSDQARLVAEARKVDIQQLPMLLFLRPDGSEVHRMQGGAAAPSQLHGIMHYALTWWGLMAQVEANPTDVKAVKEAARWQLQFSSSADAVPLLEKALELDPEGKRVYLNEVYLWLARIHASRNTEADGKKAVEYAQKCIACTLENAGGLAGNAIELIGVISLNQKDYAEAEKRFKELAAADPFNRFGQSTLSLQRLAQAADVQGKRDEAMGLLERIVQENPFQNAAFAALMSRAQLLRNQEDLQGAIAELQRAMTLWPGSNAARQAEEEIANLKQMAATRQAPAQP
jgi:tetratricopeptide (TPR) repeat protein